jgi:hypothetical protein
MYKRECLASARAAGAFKAYMAMVEARTSRSLFPALVAEVSEWLRGSTASACADRFGKWEERVASVAPLLQEPHCLCSRIFSSLVWYIAKGGGRIWDWSGNMSGRNSALGLQSARARRPATHGFGWAPRMTKMLIGTCTHRPALPPTTPNIVQVVELAAACPGVTRGAQASLRFLHSSSHASMSSTRPTSMPTSTTLPLACSAAFIAKRPHSRFPGVFVPSKSPITTW